jgi:hypothetical protein
MAKLEISLHPSPGILRCENAAADNMSETSDVRAYFEEKGTGRGAAGLKDRHLADVVFFILFEVNCQHNSHSPQESKPKALQFFHHELFFHQQR